MCWVERGAGVEPRLMIADAVVQVFLATMWIFSTRAVADGALLLSAWVEISLLRHHCRMKDWRYSQAAIQVCVLYFWVDCVARCVLHVL